MKEKLTLERLHEVLHYEPDKPSPWTWKVRKGRAKAGCEGGAVKKDGYRTIQVDGEKYVSSRLAWFYITGEWPEVFIDHENRIRSDDRFTNLRPSTNAQNMQNRDFKGYYKHGEKWHAQIQINKKNIYLGLYKTEEEARAVYLRAKLEHHPFYTFL